MKIGIYTRVSTEEQAVHGVSLIAQENALMEYAKKHDYKVVDVYSDEGLSATTLDRPGLQRLLEDVRQGRIDLILITKLDRLSRGVANYYKIADVLESNNCGWKTILEDYDSTTASGRLHINIMLSVAENEAAVTKERINFVFQNKLEKGEVICGQKIFGYDIVDKHYVINEKEAEIIRFVFENYSNFVSFELLVKQVNLKFGTNYKAHIVSRILKRKLYTGVYTNHGVDYEGYAPVIIEKDKFDKMQDFIKQNARRSTTLQTHIFSSLIKCPYDKVMSLSSCRNYKKKTYVYMRCNYTHCEHWKNKTCKSIKSKQEHFVETEILDMLVPQLNNEYKLFVEKKETIAAGSNYESEIRKIKKKMSKLEDMYLDDLISKDKYAARYKEYKEELDFYSEKVLRSKDEATFSGVDDEFIEFINSASFKEMYYKLDDTKRHAFWVNVLKEIKVDFNGSFTIVFR